MAVFVAKFLLEMARHEDKTLMSIDSLAVVFAPSFLRCPDTDPILMLQNTPKVRKGDKEKRARCFCS